MNDCPLCHGKGEFSFYDGLAFPYAPERGWSRLVTVNCRHEEEAAMGAEPKEPEPGLIVRDFFWADDSSHWHGPFASYDAAQESRDAWRRLHSPQMVRAIAQEAARIVGECYGIDQRWMRLS